MTTTIFDTLHVVSAYPIPRQVLTEACTRRGVTLEDELTAEVLAGADYNLAKADLLDWLSYAPNISQGGQSYSFSEDERIQLRRQAAALYKKYGTEEEVKARVQYGYKGSSV